MKIAHAAAFLLFVYVLVMNAWVCDDAYITLRTVDNLLDGQGLRWNPIERVQTFTHPLWMMLLAVHVVVLRNAYFATLACSFLCCVAMLLLSARTLRGLSPWRPAFLVLLLIASKAFVDYASSGLENPLSYLLLAALWAPLLRGKPHGATWAVLLASLAFVNRADTVLLAAPAVAVVLWEQRSRPWRELAGRIALGMLPALAWEAFSIFYYGFPFPNSAYAKLATGIPRADLVSQGVWYFVNSLTWDPVTLSIVAVAVVAAVLRGSTGARAAAVAALLYVVYVGSIGGDFMSGRFLAAPYLLACLVWVTLPWSTRVLGATAAAATLLALLSPAGPRCDPGPAMKGSTSTNVASPTSAVGTGRPPRSVATNRAAKPGPTITSR